VKLYCNKCKPDYTDIPRPSGVVMRTWQGLTDLRNVLLQQGRLGEAVPLHRTECAALPLAPRIDAHHIVLSHIKTAAAAAPENICFLWLEAEVQILLADSLYQADDIQQAKIELYKAETLANQCLLQLGISDPRPLLSLNWTRLLIGWEGMGPLDRYLTSIALLSDMKITRHIRTSSCFDKAAESALEVYRETESSHYYDEFFRLRKEVGDYQEMVMGNIATLLLWRESQWNETRKLAIDKSTTLQWYSDFLQRYPAFALPGLVYSLHRTSKWIFESLGDKKQAMAAKLEMAKFEADIPEDVSNKICWSQVIVRPDGNGVHDSISENYPLVDEDNFHAAYTFCGFDRPEDFKKVTMRLFLKWSAEDLQNGILSEQELHIITHLQPTIQPSEGVVDFPKEAQKGGNILDELAGLSESDLLFRIFGNSAEPVEKSLWKSRFQALEAWLGRRSYHSSRNGRQYLLLRFQEIRAYSLEHHDPVMAIEELISCVKMVPNLSEAVQRYIGGTLGDWHGAIGLVSVRCIDRTDRANRQLRQYFLNIAFHHCHKAIEIWQKDEIDARFRELGRCDFAKLCLMALEEDFAESKEEKVLLRQIGLRYLSLADEWLRNARQDLPAEDRVEEVQQRDHITQSLQPSRIYLRALQILITSTEFSPKESLEFWNWVQHSKARALAETMGVGESFPQSLLSTLKINSKDGYKLFLEEQDIREKIRTVTPNDRYYLLTMLKRKRQEMKKIPEMRQILDLMEGTPLRMEDLPTFTTGNDSSVTFVDWVEVPYLIGPGSRVVVVTVKAGETPKVHVLQEITGEEVANWYLQLFRHTDKSLTVENMMRDPETRKRLMELEELVEPLSDCTRPGDLLVLCPTSILHRIPLHAIQIAEPSAASGFQTLIHRNPVVYCPSLSVLRHCFWSSKSLPSSPIKPPDMAIFHGIPPYNNVQDDIFAAGRTAIQNLATRFNTNPILDQNLTREAFTDKTSISSLIHIHSHIQPDINESDESDPLKRYYLSFGTASQPWTLTPKDALQSLHFPAGSHITLVACDGAQFRIGPGDELLGIVPALLCAGASSVISTLWKTADRVGATFTNEFYKEFKADGGVVDVARAFQRAVVRMDEEEREPLYMWAGFVLHGYWKFERNWAEAGKGSGLMELEVR